MVRAMAHRGTSTGITLSLALLMTAALGACATGSDSNLNADGSTGGPDANASIADAGADAANAACDPNPCFDGVACAEVPDGYQCDACPAGMEGDGESCADIDGCEVSPCFLGVTCSDVAAPGDGATCGDCPDGFFGNGIILY